MNDAGKIRRAIGTHPRVIVSRIIFAGMILSALTIGMLSTTNMIRLIEKPFPGFLLNPRMVVAGAGQSHWTGINAGLKFPDKIIQINRKPVSSMKDLEEMISNTAAGDPVTYTITRRGEVIEVSVPTMRFAWAHLLMLLGVPLTAGILYLIIGVIVFILKPDSKVSWAFLLACFSLGIFTITGVDKTQLFIVRINIFTNALVPAAFVHLALLFPEKKRIIQTYPYLLFISYIIAAILGISMEIAYPQSESVFLPLYKIVMIYMILSVLSLVASTVHAYFKKSSAIARQRAKVVLSGAALALPIPATLFYLTLFGDSFGVKINLQLNFLAIPILIFPASIAYAIAKHNLFDVDVYIKRAVGYVLMTIIVGMAYFAVQTLMSTIILKPVFGASAEKLYPIIFALLVVFLFNPLNRTIQGWVDRLFYRKKFDYKETIISVSNALASVLDLNQVINQIIHTVRKEMFVDTAGLILIEPKKRVCQTFFVDNRPNNMDEPGTINDREREVSISSDDPLLALISREKKLLTRYDIEEDPHYADLRGTCGQRFSQMGASLALPLIYQNEVTGVLALGTKKSGHFYNREDIDLLTTLASHGAVAIENARLFKENLDKGRMEEELKIAHDIQTSMLPDHAPETEGFKIAGSSVPAKEVGGDFYDFIEIRRDKGGDRLGIVIGDVSGKGVSGALVMAAARSTCRVLSEWHSSVEDLMTVGNRRLNRDIKKGMFVALIFAELDPVGKTLTFSNAGQTQPIICSHNSPGGSYIDTEGDRFPLGILQESLYEEKKLQLSEGDTVVFYTDGVVEAMNARGELYGFERFMASVEEGKCLGAQALLEKLMADVACYTGDVEQHDDITIVVVKVE